MTDIQRYVPAADGGGAEMEKDDYGAWVSLDDHQARIETLVNERERLALAICAGEDALGYANAQSVGTLEKVARDNHNATMAQIDITLSLEAKLDKAARQLRTIAQIETCGGLPGVMAWMAAEALEHLEAKQCGKRIDPIVVDLKTGWFEPK